MTATAYQWLTRPSLRGMLCVGFLSGTAASVLGADRTTAIAAVTVLGTLWGFLGWFLDLRSRRAEPQDFGAWQRQIDAEYRLEIEDKTVTVFHFGKIVSQFEFVEPIEIQTLSRKGTFPPLFWRLITRNGEFLVPDGGRFGQEFEKKIVHALPGYFDQRPVIITPPEGFLRADSMWRLDDPYPKLDRSDDDSVV